MIIDIEPIVTPAEGMVKWAMEHYGQTERYVFRLPNGKNLSVEFTTKDLAEFCPTKLASELIADWAEGYQRRLDEALKVVETGLHPTWVTYIPNPDPYGSIRNKEIAVPQKLNYQQIDGWQRVADRLKPEVGPITFHKLVLVGN